MLQLSPGNTGRFPPPTWDCNFELCILATHARLVRRWLQRWLCASYQVSGCVGLSRRTLLACLRCSGKSITYGCLTWSTSIPGLTHVTFAQQQSKDTSPRSGDNETLVLRYHKTSVSSGCSCLAFNCSCTIYVRMTIWASSFVLPPALSFAAAFWSCVTLYAHQCFCFFSKERIF